MWDKLFTMVARVLLVFMCVICSIRERKCADTIGTVLLPVVKYKYTFQMKYTEAVASVYFI